MGSIIGLIFWICIIVSIVNKFKGKQGNAKNSARSTQARERINTLVEENVAKFEKNFTRVENSTATSRKSAAKYGKMPAGQAPVANATSKSDIVERAKANTKKYESDKTLTDMEREHNHSERVSSAKAPYVEKEREEHLKMHTQKMPDIEEVSMLGSVEDLMVKGYDGNLSFERDFLGEAMDMMNTFMINN